MLNEIDDCDDSSDDIGNRYYPRDEFYPYVTKSRFCSLVGCKMSQLNKWLSVGCLKRYRIPNTRTIFVSLTEFSNSLISTTDDTDDN
jgi:hypothetical protein